MDLLCFFCLVLAMPLCTSVYRLKQKKMSDFHGTVSFDPVKMLQQK